MGRGGGKGGGGRAGGKTGATSATRLVDGYIESSVPVGRFDTRIDKENAMQDARASIIGAMSRGVTQGEFNFKRQGDVIRVTRNVTDRDSSGAFLGRREEAVGTVSIAVANKSIRRRFGRGP